jgi:soluble lytic murein transglycosylase-like protein
MQLLPATARRFEVEDIWDPFENLMGGMAYLRWLLDHYQGNIDLSLAAYNAGEHIVKRYGGIPPYRETRHYVKSVNRIYNQATQSSTASPDDNATFVMSATQ